LKQKGEFSNELLIQFVIGGTLCCLSKLITALLIELDMTCWEGWHVHALFI